MSKDADALLEEWKKQSRKHPHTVELFHKAMTAPSLNIPDDARIEPLHEMFRHLDTEDK